MKQTISPKLLAMTYQNYYQITFIEVSYSMKIKISNHNNLGEAGLFHSFFVISLCNCKKSRIASLNGNGHQVTNPTHLFKKLNGRYVL